MGPLKVHPANPRYFTDGTGKAIYLTGSHHWSTLQDWGEIGNPVGVFDYSRYLDFLRAQNHNFMRMWTCEGGYSLPTNGIYAYTVGEPRGDTSNTTHLYCEPLPYARTGRGMALDGKPKFDLEQFNQAYFNRLRARVAAARQHGIYVAIMLFNGWGIYDHGFGNPWPRHPFNPANNINGINGDPDGDGEGREVHTLQVPAIGALQSAYVRKVIDTVNDLDNVLYEISNETGIFSKEWQYHMIRFIQDYESTKHKQHPVGMTYFDASAEGRMDTLLASPADWISPGNEGTTFDFTRNPMPATGRKVLLSDIDHLGVQDSSWVWKTFTRGHNPIYMDPLHVITDVSTVAGIRSDFPGAESFRHAMGATRSYAMKMNLAAMHPRGDLCSTTYCLANPGFEYLVYLPFGAHWLEPWVELLPWRVEVHFRNALHRSVSLDFSDVTRSFKVEWFNPVTGETFMTGTIAGGKTEKLKAPFSGDAVLYLAAQ